MALACFNSDVKSFSKTKLGTDTANSMNIRIATFGWRKHLVRETEVFIANRTKTVSTVASEW